jgi:hypothetical protein
MVYKESRGFVDIMFRAVYARIPRKVVTMAYAGRAIAQYLHGRKARFLNA